MKKSNLERIYKNSFSCESLHFGFPGPGITTIGQYSYFFDVSTGQYYRCLTCLRDIQYFDSDGCVRSYWVAFAGSDE